MSRHVIVNKRNTKKWVFGWDHPLQSFYLQVHDLTIPEEDRIITWFGADSKTEMYEVEDLHRVAMENGLGLDHSYQVMLHQEKDDGV